MSFLRGLLAGRSHLAFLVGLAAALLTARATGRLTRDAEAAGARGAPAPAPGPPLRANGSLDLRGQRLAAAAWSYFEENTDPATGLTASVKGHPATTMWDVGSQLMAILAAEDLALVPEKEAKARLARALDSLGALPLFDDVLPNKSYDTRTLAMVHYDGRPAPDGVGWSALDVGRVLLPLSLVTFRHPELTPRVLGAVSRWRLDALSDGGALVGAERRAGGGRVSYQEGRLGYEQYAAKALLRWGVPVSSAMTYGPHVAWVDAGGARVPADDRRPRDHAATLAPVLSEPWILEGLEHGFDAATLPLARAVLAAQERRAKRTGRPTAVSEDALDRPPWFVYSAVVNGDERWTAFAPGGAAAPGRLTFSTKAAVAWAALFDAPYADALLDSAAPLVDPGHGLLAGRYDATGEVNRVLSLNTNAVVLEALAYRVHGPLVRRLASAPPLEARR